MRIQAALGPSSKYDLRKARQLQSRGRYDSWRRRSKESRIYRCVLFALADGECPECGVEMVMSFNAEMNLLPNAATIDHVNPISKTMEHTKLDLAIMCRKCNQKKGDSMNSKLSHEKEKKV